MAHQVFAGRSPLLAHHIKVLLSLARNFSIVCACNGPRGFPYLCVPAPLSGMVLVSKYHLQKPNPSTCSCSPHQPLLGSGLVGHVAGGAEGPVLCKRLFHGITAPGLLGRRGKERRQCGTEGARACCNTCWLMLYIEVISSSARSSAEEGQWSPGAH